MTKPCQAVSHFSVVFCEQAGILQDQLTGHLGINALFSACPAKRLSITLVWRDSCVKVLWCLLFRPLHSARRHEEVIAGNGELKSLMEKTFSDSLIPQLKDQDHGKSYIEINQDTFL